MGGRALTCCLSGLVTKEPGLAAWDGLELSILWGWRQALGSGGQECIKVLQPCDLEDKRTENGEITQQGQPRDTDSRAPTSDLHETGGTSNRPRAESL